MVHISTGDSPEPLLSGETNRLGLVLDTAKPSWIDITLPEVTQISQVKVYKLFGTRSIPLTLMGSENGKNWTVIDRTDKFYCGAIFGPWVVPLQSTRYKFLRILPEINSGVLNLSQIEVL